jgi:hypothetical protein
MIFRGRRRIFLCASQKRIAVRKRLSQSVRWLGHDSMATWDISLKDCLPLIGSAITVGGAGFIA